MYRLLVFLALVATTLHAGSGYEDRRDTAELAFAQKSYGVAHRIYSNAVAQLELQPADLRWAQFRMADCRWRGQAAADQADPSRFNEAREALEVLIRDVKRVEDQDRLWAEVHESLGDSHWQSGEQNWYAAWPHYQQALDWWAGQSDLATARPRYLSIVRRCAQPDWANPWYRYGNFGNQLPFDVVENALTIAQTDEDRSWAQYLVALTAQQQGGGPKPDRVPEAFEAALAGGKSLRWYDDVLFQYAQWMESQGRAVTTEEGEQLLKPDYVKAAELYRRLLNDFAEGQTRYRDEAKSRLEDIVGPAVSVGVESYFLPGSEISFFTAWRNVKRIKYTLYAVDLVKDVALTGPGERNWLETIATAPLKKVLALDKETQDDGTHQPGQDTIKLEQALAPGAYLLVASAGGKSARELVLVTEAALTLKTSGSTALAWFCNAVDGAPLAGATVKVWQRYRDNGGDHWRLISVETGTNGLASFTLPESGNELIAFASNGRQQALAQGDFWGGMALDGDAFWKIYAFTDRTAYRPGETVSWKLLARIPTRSGYTTPAGQPLKVTIQDPRGAKVMETNLTLNAFGSAWSELAVTDKMPLGEYRVTFEHGAKSVGFASLFRLEEFKLPEFKVAVSTPEQDGRKQTFLLGDTVEADIKADYYSGGPVANASVEVVVRKRPYHRSWYPPREFDWFYRDFTTERRWRRNDGEVVKRETVKTDAEGRARVKFDTERSGQELEYFIEARVTDASRREIVGAGDVRVGNQRYFVYATPDNRLRRPGQKAHITLRAQDANDQALGVTGKVAVARLVWKEGWTNQWGRIYAGRYEEKEISVQGVTIAADGAAEFVFTPADAGYYMIRWRSPQAGGRPVTAECNVWATTEEDADIGYLHAGGVEIVVDKDTFREGETAAVMLAAPASGRWVLFGVEGGGIGDYQMVKLEGASKLIQLPVLEKHVPNIFLTAACFSDAQFSTDQKQVIVPPVKHYLSVTVTADRVAYQPREEAKLQVTVTDFAGKPVEAEVSLAVADEAVLYIQEDLAGDPRKFFYGEKRGLQVQTWTSFNIKPLRREKQKEVGHEIGNAPDLADETDKRLFMKGMFGGRPRAGRASEVDMDGFAAMGGMMEEMEAPMFASGDALASPVPASAGEVAVVVRSDFRATAFWQPDLTTDAKGRAGATVTLPDSLTSWQGKARVLTKDNQFGIADVSFVARLPLTCRLQAPRFFVVGDTCTVSAVIQNNTDEAVPVRADLAVSGLSVINLKPETRNLKPHAETRVDWTVVATGAGEAKLTASAKGGKIGDAMEKTYLVHDHGIEKFLGASTKMRGESATLRIDLPAARRADTTELVVQVAPSIAVTMLDALPYLANYPYGCTEQTMSRFLPSVVVAKTLKDLGLSPEAVADKLFGGIEAANRANRTNTLHEMDAMVAAGLERLYDFQHGDGGWGWWKYGDSDSYMTAYVLWGLALAKEAGLEIRSGVAERGLDWLEKKLIEAEDQPDLQAWELHALSAHRRVSEFSRTAMTNLWEKRDGLNAYSKALFLLATVKYGDPDQHAAILAQNLRDGVFKDESPDASVLLQSQIGNRQSAILPTARWGAGTSWWRWSEGPIESTAFVLKALLAANPGDDLIEPAMNWLVKNRRGAQWSNTRDTAYVLLALADYLRVSKETSAHLTYEVVVNGTKVATQAVTPETALGAPSRLVIDRALLRDGTNDIQIVRTTGEGPLYISAFATFYSLEEPITPAGHELFVKRQYFKIVPRPTLLKGVVYDKLPLNDGDAVRSGERIEVMIAVESKNDYEYLVFEDLKPAGFEAVEVRSGGSLYAKMLTEPAGRRRFSAGLHDVDASDYTGQSQWIYPELRDRKVALFADKLPQGLWELRYELRAETPGRFHALPVLGHAMYVPEIRANSAEIRVTVEE